MIKLKAILEFLKYLYTGSNLTYAVLCESNIATTTEFVKAEFDTFRKAANYKQKLITQGKLQIYIYVEISRTRVLEYSTKWQSTLKYI